MSAEQDTFDFEDIHLKPAQIRRWPFFGYLYPQERRDLMRIIPLLLLAVVFIIVLILMLIMPEAFDPTIDAIIRFLP